MARESYTITSAVHQKVQRTTFRHLVYNTYGQTLDVDRSGVC